jgi:hypothetical protein
MVITGWRGALIGLAALVIIGLVLAAIFWLALALAAVLVVAWFNLLLLPRLAARLHLPELVLGIALIVVLTGMGFLLAGVTGALEGAAVWLLGVAAPRAVMWRLRRRLGRKREERVTIIVPHRP